MDLKRLSKADRFAIPECLCLGAQVALGALPPQAKDIREQVDQVTAVR